MRWFQLFICLLIGAFIIQVSGCGGGGGGESATSGKLVGPDGGTLDFGSGIVVEIPSGAVSTEITLSAQLLDPSNGQSLLNESGNVQRLFAAGVRLEPSGLKFNEPITVTLPLHEKPTGDALPVHYLYDPDYHAYYPAPTNVSVSSENNTATLTLTEFSDHILAWIANVLQSTCTEEDPCRCGSFTVVEEFRDQTYSKNDCQADDIHGSITYHDCGPGGITESWLMTEHSSGCVPIMTLTAERNLLGPEETTLISAKVTYLDEPVSGLTVHMKTNDLIELDTPDPVTGDDGIAKTIVTAGTREGVAPVTAEASQLFTSRIIAANGIEQESSEKLKEMSAKTYVTVDVPAGLAIEILSGKDGDFLLLNENTKIEVAALDFSDSANESSFQFIPGVVVDLEATDGVLASTQVTTSSSGPVAVYYTAPGVEGLVTIKGRAYVETLSESGDPLTYAVDDEDTIQVQPQPPADWVGTIEMDFSGCTPEYYDDPSYCMTNGIKFSYSVNLDFSINVDESISSPSLSNPNATGAGTVNISNYSCSDGSLRTGFVNLNCSTQQIQSLCMGPIMHPFESPIEGVMRQDELWVLFHHSSRFHGNYISIRGIDQGYCDGMPYDLGMIGPAAQIFWNPGIEEESNPLHFGDDVAFLVAIDGRNSITQSGDCSSDGTNFSGKLNCAYTLTMTKTDGQ